MYKWGIAKRNDGGTRRRCVASRRKHTPEERLIRVWSMSKKAIPSRIRAPENESIGLDRAGCQFFFYKRYRDRLYIAKRHGLCYHFFRKAMSESKLTRTIRYFLSVFFSLPTLIVCAMVLYGPHRALDAETVRCRGIILIACLSLIPISFAAFTITLTRTEIRHFVIALILTGGGLVGITILAGIAIHRDFFTATFQCLLCLPAIFAFYLTAHRGKPLQKTALRSIGVAGYALSAFYAEWIMLMGYAIATRAEPRPIESIVYNVYNLALVLILLFSSREITRSTLTVVETGRDSLVVSGRDVSSMPGAKKLLLLHAFATAPDRRITCPELQRVLHPDLGEGEIDCAECLGGNRKATQCSRYRTTYNAILDLKKLLEFLEIGTILAGDNRRNILTEGWKMELFENVRLETRRE